MVVTGTVTPNEISGEPIEKVLVNNVQATRQRGRLVHGDGRRQAGRDADPHRGA